MAKRLLAAAALSILPLAAVAQEQVVNVYNWSDYVGEGVLDDFTEETGIKVVYDVYDSMEMMETKLLAGGSGYDIIVPTDRNLQRLIEAGVVQKLDKSKIPNLANQWDVITKELEEYDPGAEHSANYMWGTTAIGYNVDKIEERMPDAPTDSWAMIFDPEVVAKFADCGVHLLDSPDDMIPAALHYLGLDPDSKNPEDIHKAGDLLKSIRPSIQKFHSSEYINALANGDICLAVGYSGDVLQARDRAAEAGNDVVVEYSIPKEGALIWLDSFAIPVDAPHPDNAHAFIDFMLRPDIAARNSNYVFYANGNKASQELIDEEVITDPAIYPAEETVNKLYTTSVSPPRVQREMTRAWTEVKTGQ
ncbi:MAG TPA: polyamine ABC transporter substrate-binding protein [Propylenella sp.]